MTSRGTVFEDLDYEDEQIKELKFEISQKIKAKVQESQKSQDEFSRFLGITQSQLSQILNGHLKKFTADFLIKKAISCGYIFKFEIE